MRLAFCIFRYFPFGGLQRDMLRVARACLECGHQIEVFTMRWEGENSLNLTVNIIETQARSNSKRAQEFSNKVQPCFQDFDCVLGFNKMAGLDYYFAGDVCFQFVKKQYKPFWYRLLPRYRQYVSLEEAVFNYESKTKIFLLTDKQQREYQFCYETPSERMEIVPPGIERNDLSAAEMAMLRVEVRKALGFEEDEIVWLFVASSFYSKGLDRVMSALTEQSFPCNHLVIIGGDKAKLFEQLAERHNIAHRTHFLGAQEEVKKYMLAADILINPARVESAGMAIVEALSVGLPVVLTENCGYAFHVTQAEAGVVIPAAFELNDLVVAMRDAMSPKVREKWRQNALSYAEQVDLYSLGETVAKKIC